MSKLNIKNIHKYFEKKSKYYDNIKNSLLFILIKKKELNIFLQNVKINSDDKIIDLASGSGFYINEIKKSKPREIYAVDFSKKMLDKIKFQKVIKINADIQNLNLNKKFDKIFCFGLLEFCEKINIIFKKISNLSGNRSEIYIIFPRKNIFGFIYKFHHLLHGLSIKIRSFKFIENELKKNNLIIVKKNNTFLSTFVILRKNG